MDDEGEGRIERQLSALEANIKEKGSNSYYYAHEKKIDMPEWDGKEQPRLLEKNHAPTTKESLVTSITKYSWLDDGSKIRIYVELEGLSPEHQDLIELVHKQKSLRLEIKDFQSKCYKLIIDELYGSIEDASFKVKSDKIVITLKKKDDGEWFELKCTN